MSLSGNRKHALYAKPGFKRKQQGFVTRGLNEKQVHFFNQQIFCYLCATNRPRSLIE